MRQSEIFVRNACPADLKLLKSFYNKVTLPRQGSHFIDWNALGIGHYAGLHIEDFKVAVSGSQAVGIMGAWDQTHLKRTRITGYVRPFKWLRPLVNFFSLAVGSILLPSAGSVLRVAAVTGVAIENNDPVVFEALLKAHLQGLYKTGRYLQVGMDANSPFKTILKKLRRKHVTKGQVFYVTRGMEKPEIPSMTRLEVGWI